MKQYNVIFKNVGRNKKTWNKVYTQQPDEYDICKEIKKSGALLSKGIDVGFDNDEATNGTIFAGFRSVGEFSVEIIGN